MGFNSKIVADTTNDVTLVLWTNLTVDVDKEQQTANTLMLKILDQIYVQSPLTPAASSAAAPTPAGCPGRPEPRFRHYSHEDRRDHFNAAPSTCHCRRRRDRAGPARCGLHQRF